MAVMGLVAPPAASAELRTDRLTKGQRRAWKALEAIAAAADLQGRPRHPTLQRLWVEVDSSPHLVYVVLRRPSGSGAIAGRFRIERIDPDGHFVATLILDLRTIDRILPGGEGTQHVPFGELGRAERRAQVLTHELAHAAWAGSRPERAQQAFEVQSEIERLATLARTVGTSAPGFGAQVEACERLIRQMEEPALRAEAAVSAELKSRFAASAVAKYSSPEVR
jgi:hypothetical protein